MDIQQPLIGFLIGNTWRTFAGISHNDAVSEINPTLKNVGVQFNRNESKPSNTEQFIFGSNEATVFSIAEKECTITVLSVRWDPLTRVFLSITSSSNVEEKYSGSVSIIDIRPINTKTEHYISKVISEFVDRLERQPWKFNHPRFDFAPVLRYKVKLFWQYWL